MIDTVLIQIPQGQYKIIEHSKFQPSTVNMLTNPAPFAKYTNNPLQEDKKRHNYMPRMTLYKRGRRFNLTIEFSIPKIIYNNNVQEVDDTDMDDVVEKLKQKLFVRGIDIQKNHLKNALVLNMHPSKNIPLNNNYPVSFIISELSKANVHGKNDISRIKFTNGGEQLQIYASGYSFVIYDKIRDLTQPRVRAIDKEQTMSQRSLFDKLNGKELLRLEVRLKKKKLTEILDKQDYKNELRFKDVFNKNLNQNIINYFWHYYFDKNKFIFQYDKSQELLVKIIRNQQKINLTKAYSLIGLMTLCKDDNGMIGLKQIIKYYFPKTNWSNAIKQLKEYEDILKSDNLYNFIEKIESSLKKFEIHKTLKF